MAAAAKAARRNTTVHMPDFYLPNDPFQDPCIGRRTGVPLNIDARKDSLGFDNIDDYFPDSDPEEENIVPNVQSPDKDLIGRRTGKPLNINPRKDSKGFDNVDDYFPDSGGGKSKEVSPEKGEPVNPEKLDNPVKGSLPAKTNSENSFDNAEEQETAGTPKITESPNETGTLLKNPASSQATPEVEGPVKKRLSFSHGESPSESEPNKPMPSRALQDVRGTEVISEKEEKSDSEIDVVDVEDDFQPEVVSDDQPTTAVEPKDKTKNKGMTKQNQKQQNMSDDDDETVDVEGIDEEETFLTIGNTTQHLKTVMVGKFPVAAEAESFVMSESFVLEGTKHKTMSPEYGSCSDSQPEQRDATVPGVKKSRIPVRKKGVSVGIKQKATRGKQKKKEGELKRMQAAGEVPHDCEIGSGEEVDVRPSNDNREQKQSSRGQKQDAKPKVVRGRQKKVEEAKIDGMDDDGEGCNDTVEADNKKGKRRAKSMPGTKLQTQKLSRSSKSVSKSNTVASDEELHDGDIIENGEEQKRRKGRRSVPDIRQQQNKLAKGRKKNKGENIEVDEGENNDVADDHEKTADLKTARQGKSVAKGSEPEKPSELSGRKTRAQRRKEADMKIQKKDGGGEGGEKGCVEDVMEDESLASKKTGHQNVVQGEVDERKTRVQRKKEKDASLKRKDGGGEKPKSDTEGGIVSSEVKNLAENGNMLSGDRKDEEVELSERKTRAQRKRQENTKGRDNHEEEAGGDIEDLVVVSNVEDLEENGEMESRETEQNNEDSEKDNVTAKNVRARELHTVNEQDEEKSSSDKADQETRVGSSIHLNNASSSLESKKKGNGGAAGRRRRKRSKILPPYIVKRRANKANRARASLSTSSPDSTAESEWRTDAKKPRLEEASTETGAAENFRKGGGNSPVVVNATKSGRNIHSDRKSGERNKSVRQKSKIKNSNDAGKKSLQDGDENDRYEERDADYSVSEAGAVEGRTFEEIPADNITPRPLPRSSKPATELKSILKSADSVVCAKAASRKRLMSTDKLHSDGNDADDESVLPAKQPNRKCLSTVSFAAVPFVAVSPQDLSLSEASNRSPLLGLSFVSKNSSFRSTDGTFTPGSGRTVRSSARSASSASSPGDSVTDPDEEVTLTNDAKHDDDVSDEQSTRRSKRTIIPPLQYWKNERIDYERRKSGGWCIRGIIKNPTPTPKLRRKSKQPKNRVARKPKSVNVTVSSEEELDNEELEGFQEAINPQGIVFNPETKEDVDMDIFHVPGMLNFSSPSGNPPQDDDPLLLHKFILQPLFGGGQVILRPGAEKGRQFVRNDTMVFYVIKGRILVTVHQSSVVLGTGSTFFVPQGNSYNIKNLKQTEAKLMFVQIKG